MLYENADDYCCWSSLISFNPHTCGHAFVHGRQKRVSLLAIHSPDNLPILRTITVVKPFFAVHFSPGICTPGVCDGEWGGRAIDGTCLSYVGRAIDVLFYGV